MAVIVAIAPVDPGFGAALPPASNFWAEQVDLRCGSARHHFQLITVFS